jgi:hypothetical protein
MHNQLPGSPNLPPIPNNSGTARSDIISLSREGSISSSTGASSLHREPSGNARVSRFSVVEKDGDGKESQEHLRDRGRDPNNNSVHPSDTPHLPSHQHTPSMESRKVGRFELTAGIPSGEGMYCISYPYSGKQLVT